MKLGVARRFTAEQKAQVLALVARTRQRTGWTLRRILKRLSLSNARYPAWRQRAEQARLGDEVQAPSALSAILPEEKQAVITFALEQPRDGYRRLAWQMVDRDVAYVSPSSVYRILWDVDLLYLWKRSRRSGEAPPKPTRPNERWHIDNMYLRLANTWYFLVNMIDGYSRYVVHGELLRSVWASDVRRVVQQALEATGARAQIVSDDGSQLTGKEFKHLVRLFELEHIRIPTYHPESNGTIERFHRSTREALSEEEMKNLSTAREIIGRRVEHYNRERLHAALQYLPPTAYFEGDPEARLQERREKLERGRKHRELRNRERLQRAA